MSSSASENSVSNEPSKQWESDDDSNKNRNCDHFDQYDIEKDEKQGNEENIDGIENTASDCKRYVVKNKTNALEFLDNQEITSVFKNEKVEFDLVNSLYNAENEHSLRLEELIHPCFDRNAYNRLHEVYKHNALDDFKQDNMTNAMSEGIKHEIKMSNNIIKQATNSKESEILATRRNSNISEFELINLSNSNENNSDSLNFTNTGELVLDQEPESDNSSKSENEVLIQGIESNSKELIEEAKNEFEDYKMQLIIEAALSELKKDNEVDKKLTEQEIIRGIEEGLFDREAGYSGFSEVQDERDSEEYISGQDDVNFIGKGPTEKNDGCSRFFKTQDRDDDKSDNESDIECDNYFNNIINNYNKNKTKFNKINERMKRLNNRTLKYENKMVKIGYNKTDYETCFTGQEYGMHRDRIIDPKTGNYCNKRPFCQSVNNRFTYICKDDSEADEVEYKHQPSLSAVSKRKLEIMEELEFPTTSEDCTEKEVDGSKTGDDSDGSINKPRYERNESKKHEEWISGSKRF